MTTNRKWPISDAISGVRQMNYFCVNDTFDVKKISYLKQIARLRVQSILRVIFVEGNNNLKCIFKKYRPI